MSKNSKAGRMPFDRLVLMGALAIAVPYLLRGAYHKFHSIQRKLQHKKRASDRLDAALEDSFPASDPSALGGHIVGPLH